MKNYNRIALYTFILLISGILNSCKNKNFKEHVGPAICASDNFQYVAQPAVDALSKDLNVGPVNFTAEFNEDVPWTILITGNSSHSFKKITGYGKKINEFWKGNPDTLAFFIVETCTVEFKIACKDPVVKHFDITKVNSFANYNYLVYDGDGHGAIATFGGGYGTYATHTEVAGLNSPQGGKCLCTNGNSGTTPVWYFGGYDMAVTPGNSLNADPSTVYFNCFVNVKGSQLSVPVVQFKEGSANRSKSFFVYGDGWQYVNFKLSDLGVIDPSQISMVSFSLNAYPAQGTAGDMCIDFITFTNNTPFIPTSK